MRRSARRSRTSCSPAVDSGSTSGTTERYVPRLPGWGANRSREVVGRDAGDHRVPIHVEVVAGDRVDPGDPVLGGEELRAKRSIAAPIRVRIDVGDLDLQRVGLPAREVAPDLVGGHAAAHVLRADPVVGEARVQVEERDREEQQHHG